MYEPTKEDIEFQNKVDKGIVGITKPKIHVVVDKEDPYSYRKWAGAKKLGISINDMADEPDEMSDHSDQQGWDKHD